MDRQWVARRYQPGDEVRILELRKLVFGDRDEQRNTEAYWQWEFRDNPAGYGRIWLAVAADKVVGQFAVIPLRIQYRGEVVVGSLCLEVMTHPDYRRQAVFTTLGKKLHEELERENIPVTLGFPNRNSVEGLISKLDWIYIRSLPVFVKPLDAARITERLVTNRIQAFPIKSVSRLLTRLLSKPNGVCLEEGSKIAWIERFDDRVDVFWERLASKYPIAVVRDSTHLNWRYSDNPGREYRALVAERGDEILGYMILRCMEQFDLRGGMIVDLGALPDREPVLDALLAEAEKFFREQQMDLVACLINGDDKLVKRLRKHGFLPIARKLGFKEWHFECRLNSPTLAKEFFGEPANWFLTFGDTDII
jgi:GNAT superfamily N-acetyltransferase